MTQPKIISSHVGPVSGERSAYIDNIKGVLIVLVVAGHMTGQILGTFEPANYLYVWIYMFHMPAFVLLAGMMTDGRQIGGKEVSGMVRTLLLPYMIFQLLYMAFYTIAGKDIAWDAEQLISPMYLLWFLPALFIWRWLAPFMLRIPLSLPIAVVISLMAGMTDTLGATFSLDRAAALLPFFVLGLLLGRGVLQHAIPVWGRFVGVAILLASVFAARFFHEAFGRDWLYWNSTFAELGSSTFEGVFIRLGLLAWAALMVLSVFLLTPRRKGTVTMPGRHSMYPYLLHGFFALSFGLSSLGNGVTQYWQFILIMVGSVCFTVALSTSPVRKSLKLLVTPPLSINVRPDRSL